MPPPRHRQWSAAKQKQTTADLVCQPLFFFSCPAISAGARALLIDLQDRWLVSAARAVARILAVVAVRTIASACASVHGRVLSSLSLVGVAGRVTVKTPPNIYNCTRVSVRLCRPDVLPAWGPSSAWSFTLSHCFPSWVWGLLSPACPRFSLRLLASGGSVAI